MRRLCRAKCRPRKRGRAFVGFARITRLLDDDMALPLGAASMDNVHMLRR
ncbi:hypothetical protein ACVOMV_37095 [Mesorhizobium atlanticum]